jgi:hypothetical protein
LRRCGTIRIRIPAIKEINGDSETPAMMENDAIVMGQSPGVDVLGLMINPVSPVVREWTGWRNQIMAA